MKTFRWDVTEQPSSQTTWPGDITPLVGRILWSRGIRSEVAIQHLLQPRYEDLPRPALYLQLDTAVQRMISAVQAQEQITIYGDYDADGICATAIVVETLQALGAHVDWYLPSRTGEGYGLHSDAIETIAKQGATLLITVDCGTTNVGEIAHANSLDLDVIVIDHHQVPPEQPAALAIINPWLPSQTYPFTGHSSGGVAFTLMRGLLQATQHGKIFGKPLVDGWEKWLLDLVAISTVADMMPLTGDNRLFVHFGLQVLRKTRRPGVQALAHLMRSNLDQADEVTIGYQIGPRLNAAGRLQHAGAALRLLLTKDPIEAQQFAAELNELNLKRQELTETATQEALAQVTDQGDQAGYVAYSPDWSPGIIGLVAGRLVERVWRPVVVMTANAGSIVGSGRSIPGFDITAHLRTGHEYFERYGGHAGACGFTLSGTDGREAFANWFQSSIQLDPDQATKPLTIDTVSQVAELTPAALDQLEALSPFGVAHIRPRLLIENVSLVGFSRVGKDQKHLRLVVRQGNQVIKCIGFRLGSRFDELQVGDQLDVVIEAGWNEWNGRRELQSQIIDFRPAQ